jgi:hypothetical protein
LDLAHFADRPDLGEKIVRKPRADDVARALSLDAGRIVQRP